MVGIINYKVCNLGSISNAIKLVTDDYVIINEPTDKFKITHLVLPGVGSFSNAMEEINKNRWDDFIKEKVGQGVYLLGICLGMQILFDFGMEHGKTPGLGLISGCVKPLEPAKDEKLPHVGWNSLIKKRDHLLFSGISPNVDFYFVHSFQCVPKSPIDVLATCGYGGEFTAAVALKNIMGVQFHPEKSQPSGLKLLKNFCSIPPEC